MPDSISPSSDRETASMTTTTFRTTPPQRQIPYLENGDCLDAEEFLRRWEAMPELKQAELINGVVFMNAAQRFQLHANPSGRMVYWLNCYVACTPGVQCANEGTVQFSREHVLQPDACLLVLPEYGGQCGITEQGLLSGPPELVIEIAASSASRDLHQKKEIYERCGVREYVVWDVFANELIWLSNREGKFQRIAADQAGIFRSEVFPGLWLDQQAMLGGDLVQVRKTVEQGVTIPEHAEFVQQLKMRLEMQQNKGNPPERE